jgi:DNA mismatch endonuclease (patch repair protein)
MASVKNKNTSAEVYVRKALFKEGFRYKINERSLPGSPDIVLPKYHTCILVHGCFWHGHHCWKGHLPKSRIKFWQKKIENNKARDKRTFRKLRSEGWKVITIWQCQISTIAKREKRLTKLVEQIRSKN